MELNIILWLIGILFTLSILAIKLGFGLGFSGLRWQGICGIFFSYLVLFVLMAIFSSQLIKLLEPVLRKGPYLHAGMAMGMIVWGMFVIQGAGSRERGSGERSRDIPYVTRRRGDAERERECRGQSLVASIPAKAGIHGEGHEMQRLGHALWLIIPCPVCLTAITFSIWAALNVVKLPSLVVGLGLGCAFVLLSLLFLTFSRLRKSANPRISLGLCMITIGCYFLATLILPAKIEEAKGIYKSFIVVKSSQLVEDTKRDASSTGVLTLLFSAMLIGFFGKQRADT